MSMTREDRLKFHKNRAPKELIHAFEQMQERLYEYADILEEPQKMYKPAVFDIVKSMCMESVDEALQGINYGDEQGFIATENDEMISMEMADVHKHNIEQLLENSSTEYRGALNPYNLNGITPFDGFVPLTIIRSYMPLVGKDLMPAETPKQPFIRIRRDRKYIVTKDGQKHLRPDVYFDPSQATDILNSAKGREVTQDAYPVRKAADPAAGELLETAKFALVGFDLGAASGCLVDAGESLDIDICVKSLLFKKEGDSTPVEVQVEAYPDLTSISPRRSVSVPMTFTTGGKTYNDTLFGEYDAATGRFNLSCLTGEIYQVRFGGHISNKNNLQYISFTQDSEVDQHPISEGYRSNVPITIEDLQLYKECASIDIVANAVNEMTEIFRELEDNAIIAKVDEEYAKWTNTDGTPKAVTPFKDFTGPVVVTRDIDLTQGNDRFLKRYDYIQDEINYALSRVVASVRDICRAEPFKIRLFAHPNVTSLFVGDKIDWTINEGATLTEGIRSDYKVGIYTSDGNQFSLVSSMKFKETDGIRFLVLPVSEKNFMSWKHYKYSIIFDNNHRTTQMANVPNVLGVTRFQTQAYTPLQGKITIKGYK